MIRLSHLCRISVSLIKKVRKKAKSKKMIPATPEPKIPENCPEPEEFRRNFEPSMVLAENLLIFDVIVSVD
jgi:hypothetical protein